MKIGRKSDKLAFDVIGKALIFILLLFPQSSVKQSVTGVYDWIPAISVTCHDSLFYEFFAYRVISVLLTFSLMACIFKFILRNTRNLMSVLQSAALLFYMTTYNYSILKEFFRAQR